MKLRDINSAKLKGKVIEFRTKVTPFVDDLKLEYIKKEHLEFKSDEDAMLYFNKILEELNSEEKILWPQASDSEYEEVQAFDLRHKKATIAEEVFYNKELSDAIRELSTRSTLDYYKALKLLKLSKDYTRDVHVIKGMANVGVSMDLLVTTIKAINYEQETRD